VTLQMQINRESAQSSRFAAGRYHLYLPLRSTRPGRYHWLPAIITAGKTGSGRVLLERIWVDRPQGYRPQRLGPGDQASGLDGLIAGDGFYDIELFGSPPRPGRWTGKSAWLELPGGHGELIIELCAPRPEPAAVTLTLTRSRWRQVVTVGPSWQGVVVELPDASARVQLLLEIENPFVPATEIAGSSDRRELGVVLGEIRLQLAP